MTSDGRHELDASIMDGRDLSAGAVAGLTDVKIHKSSPFGDGKTSCAPYRRGGFLFCTRAGLEIVPNSIFD